MSIETFNTLVRIDPFGKDKLSVESTIQQIKLIIEFADAQMHKCFIDLKNKVMPLLKKHKTSSLQPIEAKQIKEFIIKSHFGLPVTQENEAQIGEIIAKSSFSDLRRYYYN